MGFLDSMANQFMKDEFEKETTYKVEWEGTGVGLTYYGGTEEVRANSREEASRITRFRIKRRAALVIKVKSVREEK
ncbi:hypothetical protein [Listeria valentina]|uniref:hypothetical protein n=1 Tax=Listeria valentina TaxID=2705293 RepID=UPI00142F72C3|nr:hypothetical protein [Listeria valentina]